MNMLWHSYRTMNAQSLAQAESAAQKANRDVHGLEERLDRVLLLTEALWTLVRTELNLTDKQLIERINEIDMSDGQLDGKVRRPPASCVKCGRKFGRGWHNCMYCGAPASPDPFSK